MNDKLDTEGLNAFGMDMDKNFAEILGVPVDDKVVAMLGATLGQADAEGITPEKIKEAIDYMYEPEQREIVGAIRAMIKMRGTK